MKDAINAFLKSGEASVDLEFKPLIEYADVLHELGFNTKEGGSLNLCNTGGNDYESNGWQVDFWWKIHREGQMYILGGSLFYGKMKLSKN